MSTPKPVQADRGVLGGVFRHWKILQEQFGAQGVKMRVDHGEDAGIGGWFQPETNTIQLNRKAIEREAAKYDEDPGYWARAVLRHELAHWQQMKRDDVNTAIEHQGRFPRINQSLQGAHSNSAPGFPGRSRTGQGIPGWGQGVLRNRG